MSPRPLDLTFTPAGASELFPSQAPLSPSAGEFVAAFTELAAIDPAAWCLSRRPPSALQTLTGTPNRLNMGQLGPGARVHLSSSLGPAPGPLLPCRCPPTRIYVFTCCCKKWGSPSH